MRSPLNDTNAAYRAATDDGAIVLDPPAEAWEADDAGVLSAPFAASRQIHDAWMRGEITTAEVAAEIMRLITADVAAGRMPWPIGSFAELHDHVDANTYLIDVVGMYRPDSGPDLTDDAAAMVDAWLGATAK